MNRRVLAAATVALLLPACSQGVGTFFAPTAAVVGGVAITEAEVIGQLRLYIANQQNSSQLTDSLTQGSGANLVRLDAKRGELSNLVQLAVIVQQARKMGITVSDTEVQKAVDTSRGSRTPAAFAALLKQLNVTMADLRRYERDHLYLNALQAEVTRGINATADQIAAAYTANKATFDAEYHAAHILFCSHSNPDGSCQLSQADVTAATAVAQQVQAGGDFGQLAARYSVDTQTKAKGGDLGWADPGQFLPAFETAALALQPGQVTPQPVQTQDGLHIIKLIAKGRSMADATDAINAQLEQTARTTAFSRWLGDAVHHTSLKINPAFGQFDPQTLGIVAPPGAVPSPAAPSGP